MTDKCWAFLRLLKILAKLTKHRDAIAAVKHTCVCAFAHICMYVQTDAVISTCNLCCRVNAVVPSGILTEATKAWAAGVGMTPEDVVNYQSSHMSMQRYPHSESSLYLK